MCPHKILAPGTFWARNPKNNGALVVTSILKLSQGSAWQFADEIVCKRGEVKAQGQAQTRRSSPYHGSQKHPKIWGVLVAATMIAPCTVA